MPKTPRIPLGLKGLNKDIPSHTLPLEFFNDGNNMRPFNGALTGVNSFAAVPTTSSDPNVFKVNFAVSGESSAPTGIYDAAQFTPAGSEYYNILALVKHADNSYQIKAFTEDSTASNNPVKVETGDTTIICNGLATVTAGAQLIQETSGATGIIRYDVTKGNTIRIYSVNGTFNTSNNLDIKYPPIDSASAQDLYVVDANNANTSTRLKPNSVTDNTATGKTVGYNIKYSSDMFVFNECLILNGATHKPLYLSSQDSQMAVVDNWPADVTIPKASGDQVEFLATPKIATYGGRLVALGLFGVKASNNLEGDYNERASIIFSSPITTMASLAGIEWTVASTNSTVDDVITESPGPIVDGGQLGDNFIVYKSDMVLSYREVTSSPYIIGRVIQTEDGMISSRCFADIGSNQHIVFGNHSVYIHNGDYQKQIVSKGKIQDALYADINSTKVGQCFVFRHEKDKETYFCIPTTNHSGEGCNKAYVYAEETDSWYTRDLDNYTHIFTTELSGVVRIFGTKPTSNQLQELSSTDVVSGGTVEFLNNPLETSSIVKTVSEAYPLCDGQVKIGLSSTDKLGTSNSVTTKDFNPASDSKLNFRETGRYFDMKIEMNGTTNPKVTSMEFEVKPRGRR